MADQFIQTTTTGYGNRIVNSIKGVIVGLILFVVSFGLLYWNEGRVDVSNIAKTAAEISSATVSADSSLSGKLVSTTGTVNSNQSIGDNLFLNPGTFIAVNRKVEMYSWVEKTDTHTTTNAGGSETTQTIYTYSKDWQENPKSSSSFNQPSGHENPQKGLDSYTNKTTAATVGAYSFDPQSVALPDFSQLPLNSQNVTLSSGATLANGSYLFIRKSTNGTFDNPQVGDLRISYHVLSPGFSGTIFGKLDGSKIDPYADQNGNNLYRLFIGTRDQAVATLHTEYTTLLWIVRLFGFLFMWFGLSALFGPISVLLDILPILGAISRSLIGVITFLVALVLTLVTIFVSMFLHSPIALLVALIIAIGAIIAFIIIFKKKKVATALVTATVPTSTPPPTNQLESYVTEARTRGMTNDQIRQALLSSGWSNDDVTRVLG
ncbi:MAG: TMEM43 family protein [Minisyncoccota bacterium]